MAFAMFRKKASAPVVQSNSEPSKPPQAPPPASATLSHQPLGSTATTNFGGISASPAVSVSRKVAASPLGQPTAAAKRPASTTKSGSVHLGAFGVVSTSGRPSHSPVPLTSFFSRSVPVGGHAATAASAAVAADARPLTPSSLRGGGAFGAFAAKSPVPPLSAPPLPLGFKVTKPRVDAAPAATKAKAVAAPVAQHHHQQQHQQQQAQAKPRPVAPAVSSPVRKSAPLKVDSFDIPSPVPRKPLVSLTEPKQVVRVPEARYTIRHAVRAHGSGAEDDSKRVWACAFRPPIAGDGGGIVPLLATIAGNAVCFTDCSIGQVVKKYEHTTTEEFFCLAWTVLGGLTPVLATAGASRAILLIDERLNTCTRALQGHTAPVYCLDFSPAHPALLASGSKDGQVRLWNIAGSSAGTCLAILRIDVTVNAVSFVPSGRRLLTAGDDRVIQLWTISDVEVLEAEFEDHNIDSAEDDGDEDEDSFGDDRMRRGKRPMGGGKRGKRSSTTTSAARKRMRMMERGMLTPSDAVVALSVKAGRVCSDGFHRGIVDFAAFLDEDTVVSKAVGEGDILVWSNSASRRISREAFAAACGDKVPADELHTLFVEQHILATLDAPVDLTLFVKSGLSRGSRALAHPCPDGSIHVFDIAAATREALEGQGGEGAVPGVYSDSVQPSSIVRPNGFTDPARGGGLIRNVAISRDGAYIAATTDANVILVYKGEQHAF